MLLRCLTGDEAGSEDEEIRVLAPPPGLPVMLSPAVLFHPLAQRHGVGCPQGCRSVGSGQDCQRRRLRAAGSDRRPLPVGRKLVLHSPAEHLGSAGRVSGDLEGQLVARRR